MAAWMRFAAVTAAAAFVAAAGSAAGDGERVLRVVNHTGKLIESLYVSEVASDDWEEDVLGDDVLADGESVEISFAGYDPWVCHFDVLATNESGDSWLLPDLDLCATPSITITAASAGRGGAGARRARSPLPTPSRSQRPASR